MTHSRQAVLTNVGQSLGAAGEKLLKAIEADGFIVESALKTKSFISAATRHPPDLFLLNPARAKMNAYHLCARIKKASALARIPVVFIAAKALKADLIRGFEAGAVDFIVRPFNHEEILARLRSHINQYRRLSGGILSAEECSGILESLPAILLEVGRDGEIHHFRASPTELALDFPSIENPKLISEIFPLNLSLVLLDAVCQVGDAKPVVVATCPAESIAGPLWLEFIVSRKRAPSDSERFIVLVQDITERKLAERERRDTEESLRQEEKMESIGRFAGGVSHDMNNILSVIMGLASNRRSLAASESDEIEEMDQIIVACRKGYELTTQLSNLGPGMSFNREPLSLNAMIDEAVDLLNRAVPDRITLSTALSPDLVDISADPVMIHHVLINLALNSADAISGNGVVEFSTRNFFPGAEPSEDYPKLEPGRYVVLQVSDTGRGMTDREKDHAFEPFFSSKPKSKASGLGLSIVYGIVRNHNGRIVLDSAFGKGTTVRIFLPAHMTEAQKDAPRCTVPFETQKCLVVDDEELILYSTQRLLRSLGFMAVMASSGEKAVRIFAEQKGSISFVILDLVMPDMDGFQTLEELRKIDPNVRVLICTGYFKEQDFSLEELISQDTVGFFRKPFGLNDLTDAIEKLLG